MSNRVVYYRIQLIILVFFVVIMLKPLMAQTPLYRNFTDEDGLPSNMTYQIFEDPKGYLYITTAKGICRFDGSEFVKIKLPNLQSEDMPMAAMDSLGRLWAANLAGELIVVDGFKVEKLLLQNRPEKSTIKSIVIFKNIINIKFVDIENSNIYNSFYHFHSNKIEFIESQKLLPLITNNSVDKVLNVQYFNNILQVDYSLNNKEIITETYPKNNLDIFINKILPNGDTTKSCINRELKFNSKHNFERNIITKLNSEVNKFFITPKKDLIFTSSYISKNLITYLFLSPSYDTNIILIKNRYINSIYANKENRFWITTKDNGILLINNLNYLQIFDNEEINSKIAIKDILNFDKNILIGLDNGVLKYINKYNFNIETIAFDGSGSIYKFQKINENEVLILFSNMLIHYNLKTKTKRFLTKNIGQKTIFIHNNDKVYIATNFGVVYSIENQYKNFIGESKRLSHIRTYALNQRNDTLLMGSTKGLYGYTNDTSFPFKGFREFELYITKLFVDSLNTIWICTDGKGLIAYNNANDIKYYGIEDGLPSLNCTDIVQVDKNRIAVGTDKGLWIYNLKTKNSFLFNKLDGLNSNEITALANDGEYLWIGTSKGLVKCKIDALKPNPEIPFIEITNARYEYNGKFSNLDSKLNYYQNHLIFNVSSRSLLAGKSKNYYYRVIGLDSNWVHTSDSEIELLGLNPGNYTFEVKVYNEDGVPCLSPASYSFTISPPWWRTIWFYSFTILLIGGVIFWWLKMIKKREPQKYQVQNQINEFRQQALQSQMNPHFIFNSLNAIQSFLTINDEKNAMLYLSKFGRLIRLIFDQSKVKLISIEEEIEMLKNYLELEKLRFKGKVDVRLVIDAEVEANEQDYMVPPLLIQPIIENSFRHGLFHKGDGGILEVIFTLENSGLKCIIRDNGIGRAKSSEINKWRDRSHKSSGLSTTMDRVKILDNNQGKMKLIINDLVNNDGSPIGTETIIYF